MCTLIALHRCTPEASLVIAANRDEYLDRPAEGPSLHPRGRLRVAAPLDLRAGGTWMGLNEAGLFAGVTNRPTRERDDTRRSRGHLVFEALEWDCAREAARALGGLPSEAYNPFNLLVADGRDAFVVVYEAGPRIVELAPGAHVIGNADPDARSVPKLARLMARAHEAAALSPAKRLDALAAICRSHEGEGGPLEDTCIHAGGYGTRSSALLRLGEGDGAAWWSAEGPPCRTDYEDFTFLLRELGRGDRLVAGGPMTRSQV